MRNKTGLVFVLVIAIAIIGFALRLVNLTKIPVFADEAIYIRWAQVMKAEPTLRFVPLSDGKQPLFMWTVIPFLKIFSDPLVAGRMVSLLSGVGTSIGIGLLSFLLFKSRKAALLASFLYVLSPFTFFFDRLALVDSMLTLFGVWFLVFLTLSVQTLRWDAAMLAGFALGGALLTKSPGLFFLILIPASIFLVKLPAKNVSRVIYLGRIIALWLVTIVIGYGMAQILRLGPNYEMIASRNLDYVFPLSHLLENPTDPFVFNLDRALEWIVILGPIWLPFIWILGLFKSLRSRSAETILLLGFLVGPFLVGCMFARVFTARYILYTLPPFFVLAGMAALYTKKVKAVVLVLLALFVVHSLWMNVGLMTDPTKVTLPQSERSGYLQEWSAGWGIVEAANYIKNQRVVRPTERIIVGTEGYFGTLPDGIQMYLEGVPNMAVVGMGLNFKKIPQQLLETRKVGDRAFFAVNSSRLNKEFKWDGLKLVYSYTKPMRLDGTHEFVAFGPQETFYLFELN